MFLAFSLLYTTDAVAGPSGNIFEASNYSSNANSSGNVTSELIAKSRSSE